jgi:hypothetical protein
MNMLNSNRIGAFMMGVYSVLSCDQVFKRVQAGHAPEPLTLGFALIGLLSAGFCVFFGWRAVRESRQLALQSQELRNEHQ